MTKLLQQVIAQIEKLPSDKQDAIATLILEELEEDQRWDDSFARLPTYWLNWPPKQWQNIGQAKRRNR
jgi:hypothetical protein